LNNPLFFLSWYFLAGPPRPLDTFIGLLRVGWILVAAFALDWSPGSPPSHDFRSPQKTFLSKKPSPSLLDQRRVLSWVHSLKWFDFFSNYFFLFNPLFLSAPSSLMINRFPLSSRSFLYMRCARRVIAPKAGDSLAHHPVLWSGPLGRLATVVSDPLLGGKVMVFFTSCKH